MKCFNYLLVYKEGNMVKIGKFFFFQLNAGIETTTKEMLDILFL